MPSDPLCKSGSTQKESHLSLSRSHRHLSRSLGVKTESPRVVLGHNAIASLPTELNKLCLSLPLVIYSPSRLSLANRIRGLLPNMDACFMSSDTHPGSAILSGRDSVVSVGGPRAVALARRISLKMSILHICVPTTHNGAAGNLPLWGSNGKEGHGGSRTFEEGGDERGDDEDRSLPAVIIYDKRLTESRIRRFSVLSGVWDDTETEAEAEADADIDSALVVVPDVAIDADASILTPAKSSTAQWSYIHLPGI